jgi:arsenate reductase
MNIQILGTKKCRETQKAIRFFKERRIPFHFRDLTEKGLSRGELENIKRNVKPEELIDTDSKRYKERGLKYMIFDPEETLLEDPLLIRTPIVRNMGFSTAGYTPETWLDWLK